MSFSFNLLPQCLSNDSGSGQASSGLASHGAFLLFFQEHTARLSHPANPLGQRRAAAAAAISPSTSRGAPRLESLPRQASPARPAILGGKHLDHTLRRLARRPVRPAAGCRYRRLSSGGDQARTRVAGLPRLLGPEDPDEARSLAQPARREHPFEYWAPQGAPCSASPWQPDKRPHPAFFSKPHETAVLNAP